jgi:hypothetical protein
MRHAARPRENPGETNVLKSPFVNRLRLVIVLAATCLAGQPGEAQNYRTPRTPWGDPDLQGLWSNQTSTPLERPDALRDKDSLTRQEAEEREEAARLSADRPPQAGDPGTYNAFWRDPGMALTRTSLIVDPPDGRVPALTSEGQARVAARAAAAQARGPVHPWEDFSAWTRCITRGVIKINSFYSSSHQIVQSPGYVVIVQELIHEARVVPLDGRPHLSPVVRQWMGDPRGRWDGETLVVETTNFTDMSPMRGSGDTMRLVERFTRVGRETIDYRFTIDDPHIFTRPWTVSMPMTRGGPIFEYACHEGNYAMGHMLGGARSR